MTVPRTARVLAVCVVAAEHELDPRKPDQRTAIDKRPADGAVSVSPLGLIGDHVCDTKHHGGLEQAVYAYSEHEAARWARELGRALPVGWFGENLRIDGDTTDLVVGSRFRVGETLLLEATIPRTPCRTFGMWSGEKNWLKRFTEQADTGAYFRVIETGTVRAGDTLTPVALPAHGATIRDVFCATNADRLHALLSCEDLPPKVRRDAEKAVRRAR